MRANIFGLRAGSTATTPMTASPVQTPSGTPLQAASHPDSGVYVGDVEPLSLPPPVSSAPNVTASRSRPISRISLTPFRKPTQSPAPSVRDSAAAMSSPVPVPTPVPSPAPIMNGTGSVSYLDTLGLKLGEAVNKALVCPHAAAPTMGSGLAKAAYIGGTSNAAKGGVVTEGSDVIKGRKPVPTGRGRALGTTIAGEMHHASKELQDQFLYRAIIRLLQRPLSVLISNLNLHATNLINCPDFPPAFPLITLNATQIHALALAHFASEVLETFDSLGLGRAAQRGQIATDSLRPIKEGLENVVTRVLTPFIGVIKTEVSVAIMDIEKDSSAADRLDRTITRLAPLLSKITFCGEVGQSAHVQSILATLKIGATWTSLVALAHRPVPHTSSPETHDGIALRKTASEGKLRPQASHGSMSTASGDSSPPDYGRLPSYITPPDTPQVAALSLSEKSNERDPKRSSSGSSLSGIAKPVAKSPSPPPGATSPHRSATPSTTKKISLAMLPSLKPLSTRSPSPPMIQKTAASPPSTTSSPIEKAPAVTFTARKPLSISLYTLSQNAQVTYKAISKIPMPLDGIAQEAIDEALKEMAGFVSFVKYIASDEARPVVGVVDIDHLMEKTRETPMLLALPILLRSAIATIPSSSSTLPQAVSGWIGLGEEEYRRSCLSGFAKADDCALIIGKALLKNPSLDALPWLRTWLDKSVKEEEDESDED